MDKEAINALAEKFGAPASEVFEQLVVEQAALGEMWLGIGFFSLILLALLTGVAIISYLKIKKSKSYEGEGWTILMFVTCIAIFFNIIFTFCALGDGVSKIKAPRTHAIESIMGD